MRVDTPEDKFALARGRCMRVSNERIQRTQGERGDRPGVRVFRPYRHGTEWCMLHGRGAHLPLGCAPEMREPMNE